MKDEDQETSDEMVRIGGQSQVDRPAHACASIRMDRCLNRADRIDRSMNELTTQTSAPEPHRKLEGY